MWLAAMSTENGELWDQILSYSLALSKSRSWGGECSKRDEKGKQEELRSPKQALGVPIPGPLQGHPQSQGKESGRPWGFSNPAGWGQG